MKKKIMDNLIWPALGVLAMIFAQDAYMSIRAKLLGEEEEESEVLVKSDLCDFEGDLLNISCLEDGEGKYGMVVYLQVSEGHDSTIDAVKAFEEKYNVDTETFFE